MSALVAFARTNRKELKRFVKFSLVGVMGAIVDFGTFNALSLILGMQGVFAQAISFCVAVASSFTWNRFWIYPDSRSKAIGWQLSQFLAVSLLGLLIRTPIFAALQKPTLQLANWLAHQVALSTFTPEWLANNLALAGAIVVILFWNFFVNRYWTYSDVR